MTTKLATKNFSAILPGVGACIIWSACNISNKVVLDAGVAPLTLLLGQLLVSAPVLWIVAFCRSRKLPVSGKGRLFRLGFWQPGIAYGASFIGLTMTSVTVEALLFSVETLMIIYFAWVLLGERPPSTTIAAGILGSVGVALVTGLGSSTNHTVGLLGPVLILIGVAGAALYSVLIKREVETQSAVPVVAIAQCGGLTVIALAWLIWPDPERFASLTVETLLIIGVSGLLMHSLAFVLFVRQLETLTASTASLLLLSIPVMTAVLGYVLLDERLSTLQIAGATVVMGALLLQVWPRRT